MSDLDELLGIDMTDPTQKLAADLVAADFGLIDLLVKARHAAGLDAAAVADRMGVSVGTVRALERVDSDPHLSTIRRYALAVGVKVEHSVSRPGS